MFDPYHKWLGIPRDQRPPTCYQLLGVVPSEDDPEVIEEMAIRQTTHVRTYQTGPHAEECTQLLNEIAQARTTLLNPARRRAYDAWLREAAPAKQPKPAAVAVEAPAVSVVVAPPSCHPLEPFHFDSRPDIQIQPFVVGAPSRAARYHQRRHVRRHLLPVPLLVSACLLGGLAGAGAAFWWKQTPEDTERPATTAADGEAAQNVGPEVRRFEGHAAPVHAVAFSPDGRHALSGGGAIRRVGGRTESLDCLLRLWDVATGKEVRRFPGHRAPVLSVAFSRDGRQAVSGGGAVEAAEGEELPLDCTMRLWDVATGTLVRRFEGHTGPVRAVAFHPDGRRVFSGGLDGTILLWDRDTVREHRRVAGQLAPVECLALAPNGRYLLSGDAEGVIRLWDVGGGEEQRIFCRLDGPVRSLAFSPDGRRILGASGAPPADHGGETPVGAAVRLWDAGTGKEIRRLGEPTSFVLSVAFSPDGHRALCGGPDKTVGLWDLDRSHEPRRFAGHHSAVHCVAFSPDGQRALSGGEDRTVRLWCLKR
jgi:WD40 repeat protein